MKRQKILTLIILSFILGETFCLLCYARRSRVLDSEGSLNGISEQISFIVRLSDQNASAEFIAEGYLSVIDDALVLLESKPGWSVFCDTFTYLTDAMSSYDRFQVLGSDFSGINEYEQGLLKDVCMYALKVLDKGDAFRQFQAVSILNHALSLIAGSKDFKIRVKDTLISYLWQGNLNTRYHAIEAVSGLAVNFMEIDPEVTTELIEEITLLFYEDEEMIVKGAVREIIYLTEIAGFPEYLRDDTIRQLISLLNNSEHSPELRSRVISCLHMLITGDMNWYDDVFKAVSAG